MRISATIPDGEDRFGSLVAAALNVHASLNPQWYSYRQNIPNIVEFLVQPRVPPVPAVALSF
ncbi:MAG TPA: hypothetical protein VGQ46_09540 [Thermoanaerobaculia bacterium]|jgi:hypothetical protein|nr:hypothetical protein [Thermoanaerobaculia bacterium]